MAASGKCDSRHNLIACTRSFIHSVTRSSGPLRKTALYPRIGIHPLSRDGPLCINPLHNPLCENHRTAMMLHNYYDPIEGLTSCTSRTKPNTKLGFFVWRSALFKERKGFGWYLFLDTPAQFSTKCRFRIPRYGKACVGNIP